MGRNFTRICGTEEWKRSLLAARRSRRRNGLVAQPNDWLAGFGVKALRVATLSKNLGSRCACWIDLVAARPFDPAGQKPCQGRRISIARALSRTQCQRPQ